MKTAGDDSFNNAESMIANTGANIASMSADAIQKLLYNFQVRQIELELQNEELKKSYHELMLSRDRFARLYNLSSIGYLTLDESGVIQVANPAAMQLFGATDMVNKKLYDFITPSDQYNYCFFIHNILTKHTEQVFATRFNNSIYVEFRGICNINENSGAQIYLSILDMTASKNAHETIAALNNKLEEMVFQQKKELAETNQDLVNKIEQLKIYKQQLIDREVKLNSIFNAAVEGIITIYLSGVVVSVNNAVESIFGYHKEELINSNINKVIPLSQQENNELYIDGYSSAGVSGIVGKIKEVTGVRKDGSSVPLDISVAQFSIDGTTYLTFIVRDVTARKQQEQHEQEHLDELAYVTRLGLMGEMASGIAHEVNQPLTAVASYSQACLNIIRDERYSKDQLADVLQKINQQSLKAGQIIHRMRDFVKPKNIHRSNINVNELIYNAIALCECYFKQHSIKVHLQLKKKLPVICADSMQIEQVVLNLVKNSIDSLIVLPQAKTRNLSIQTVVNRHRNIEIRIKDNGPGINEDEQKKILTPFYTTKSDGMGMGLSICRSIIEAHEGVLRFNSQSGKGATFYFTLPIRRRINDA